MAPGAQAAAEYRTAVSQQRPVQTPTSRVPESPQPITRHHGRYEEKGAHHIRKKEGEGGEEEEVILLPVLSVGSAKVRDAHRNL